jgi:D-3-phosphoglycerate dehydrogenase
MAAIELRDFIELGNIKNSVNYPNVALPATGHVRLAILNKNVPSMLQQITDVIASENINIVNMANASKKDNAYTLVEIADDISDAAVAKLAAIEGVTKVRVIK